MKYDYEVAYSWTETVDGETILHGKTINENVTSSNINNPLANLSSPSVNSPITPIYEFEKPGESKKTYNLYTIYTPSDGASYPNGFTDINDRDSGY